jgi:hypothetical protein
MVVAAQYSELLADGNLVPCRVYQPPEQLGSDMAMDPLLAYQRYCQGERTFCFLATVEQCYEQANRFNEAGIPSAVVEAKTKHQDRKQSLDRFKDGELRVLFNVYALTEGVDVPAARACIIGRNCEHLGMYLQIAGRILRPAPGKPDARLIDLNGLTLRHGMPTEDRSYSLEGEGIKRTSAVPVRQCLQCGAVVPAYQRTCPECDYEPPTSEANKLLPTSEANKLLPRIWDIELREVYAGPSTPGNAKQREYERLRELGRARGWNLYFVQKEYQKLFGEAPVIADATEAERAQELARLMRVVIDRGYKPGYALHRFKQMFGAWPSVADKSNATRKLEESNGSNQMSNG